jgi:hypothetical protein
MSQEHQNKTNDQNGPKVSLIDAIENVDELLQQLNKSTVPTTINNLMQIEANISTTTFDTAQTFEAALISMFIPLYFIIIMFIQLIW